MKSIRCGRGLGDSIYLQSVVRHLVMYRDAKLAVCTDWPDVFLPLHGRVELVPFRRNGVDIPAHYVMRKHVQDTTQFQDCCHAARIEEPVELKLEWRQAAGPLIEQVMKPGRPVVLVALPRAPMGRDDGFGLELLPEGRAIQQRIDELKGRATIVQVGAGRPLHKFQGIDIDLANRTSVAEMIDLASVSTGMLGYCSFILPLAESLDKPILLAWSYRGLKSGHDFIRTVTPAKLLHKPQTSFWFKDNDNDDRVAHAMRSFCAAMGI